MKCLLALINQSIPYCSYIQNEYKQKRQINTEHTIKISLTSLLSSLYSVLPIQLAISFFSIYGIIYDDPNSHITPIKPRLNSVGLLFVNIATKIERIVSVITTHLILLSLNSFKFNIVLSFSRHLRFCKSTINNSPRRAHSLAVRRIQIPSLLSFGGLLRESDLQNLCLIFASYLIAHC